jgi:hypothetical protein
MITNGGDHGVCIRLLAETELRASGIAHRRTEPGLARRCLDERETRHVVSSANE